jgi:hypothetical protein
MKRDPDKVGYAIDGRPIGWSELTDDEKERIVLRRYREDDLAPLEAWLSLFIKLTTAMQKPSISRRQLRLASEYNPGPFLSPDYREWAELQHQSRAWGNPRDECYQDRFIGWTASMEMCAGVWAHIQCPGPDFVRIAVDVFQDYMCDRFLFWHGYYIGPWVNHFVRSEPPGAAYKDTPPELLDDFRVYVAEVLDYVYEHRKT